jgi:lysine-N-methylase
MTEAEYRTLAAHDWTEHDAGLTPERLYAPRRPPRGSQVWRLRPLPSGACRFLTDDGLCLVHATLGLAAKPFAGRLFPFTFLRTPVGVFVGVRFNCPAVVRGIGPALEEQRPDIERLYREYDSTYGVPEAGERMRFFGRYELGWDDLLRVEEQLLDFLRDREFDLPRRLLACRRLVRQFVGGAVRGGDEGRIGAEPNAILGALRHDVFEIKRLSGMERRMVRLLVATFLGARLPSFRERSLPGRAAVRMGNLGLRMRMAARAGRVTLPEVDERVPIRAVSQVPLTELDAESELMLTRYFTAKVASQRFFGPALFDRSFAEGLDLLIASHAAILWLAAAHALAAGRRRPEPDDVAYGIRHVDYGYNSLGQFGGRLDRLRAMLFWHWETPEKLMAALSTPRPEDHAAEE